MALLEALGTESGNPIAILLFRKSDESPPRSFSWSASGRDEAPIPDFANHWKHAFHDSQGKPAATLLLASAPDTAARPHLIRLLDLLGEYARLYSDRALISSQEMEIKQLRERISHCSALAQAGEASFRIFHELRNAASWLNGRLIVAAKTLTKADPCSDKKSEALSHFTAIRKSTDHLLMLLRNAELIGNGLRPAGDSQDPVCLRELIEDLSVSLGIPNHCRFTLTIPSSLKIRWKKTELVQIVLNILSNACDALEGTQKREIRIHHQAHPDTFDVHFENNGKPIPPDQLERIFEPHFTTKSPERGSGLGLSICRELLERHGGSIRAASSDSTTFTVSFPVQIVSD